MSDDDGPLSRFGLDDGRLGAHHDGSRRRWSRRLPREEGSVGVQAQGVGVEAVVSGGEARHLYDNRQTDY